jgi:hypothetical protein
VILGESSAPFGPMVSYIVIPLRPQAPRLELVHARRTATGTLLGIVKTPPKPQRPAATSVTANV